MRKFDWFQNHTESNRQNSLKSKQKCRETNQMYEYECLYVFIQPYQYLFTGVDTWLAQNMCTNIIRIYFLNKIFVFFTATDRY